MGIPYIIYNGVDSRDLGVIVEKLPDFPRAQRRIVETPVPGRSGMLVEDDGAYELNTTTLRLNCGGASLRDVYGWLRGEGWLISSDEPTMKMYAYCYNSIDDQRFRLDGDCWDSLSINLRTEPYLREVDEEVLHFLSNQNQFPGRGHDPAQPLIAVTGSGSANLMINGVTLYFSGLSGAIYVDCEAGIAYELTAAAGGGTAMVFAGEKVSLDEGEWPSLRPEGGTNQLTWTGNITGVDLTPQWRWL